MFSDDPEEDLEIVTYIHDQIIDASGGSKGYHDEKLVRSALARPLYSVMNEDAYKTVYEKAAALLDSIARNHGFRDGNKRTAMAAASYYLDENDVAVDYTNKEYEEFMLLVVNDRPSVTEIAKWLHSHSETIPPTKWSLVDAQEMAKKHPETFKIPSTKDIKALKVGSTVKLIFDIDGDSAGGERMWVVITKIAPSEYVGELDNDPAVIRGLKYKDTIHFNADNIASIWED